MTAAGADRYAGEPVQDQLEAYNRGDVEAFLSCYTEDAVVSDGVGVVRMSGRAQMRERYTRRLASPGLHCTVVQRMVAGDWTVDHEHLTGFDGGDSEALVAFRTAPDNRIDRVVFLSSVTGPRATPRSRHVSEPVERRLEAYNRGDVEALVSCFTGDAVVTDETGAVRLQGMEQLRERYTRRPAAPGLHCTVAARLVAMDWTVAHELVTSFEGADAEFLAAYRTGADERIERLMFLVSP